MKAAYSSYEAQGSGLDIHKLFRQLQAHNHNAIGYPTAKGYDYSSLYPFLTMPVNNCGDPYGSSTYKVQTHQVEREVVSFMADLFRAPKDDHWGYVTNGGTEGNLYGLYLGRETFPEATAYYTKAAHYSIRKNLDLLRIQAVEIEVDATDSMDLHDFRKKLNVNAPAIVMATCGTTMRQGRDDVIQIKKILKDTGVCDHYIHCDAALDGMIAPFLSPRPAFDFVDGSDSISVSGHKFIGCPIPCGIVICRRHKVEAISRYIPYINGYDDTITGSRNGITPLFLWYAINKIKKKGLAAKVKDCVERAEYACRKLRQLGVSAKLNQNTITVVFPRPPQSLVEKWQLATQGNIAHLLTVPGVSYENIDVFSEELAGLLKRSVQA